MIVPEDVSRFWKYVDRSSACWNWVGRNKVGEYGRIKISGRSVLSHRYSYELHFGEIPKGKLVCHKCDNPLCVRPDHLFIGTYQDNVDDMVAKGRGVNLTGENHGRSKLKNCQVLEIRSMYSSGRYFLKDLSNIFGVSVSQIHKCVKLIAWKHL